ncbi:MAG: glycosyltransferase [Vicinamibacterales bacterium]|nr:glycosyltransferase [Vicinamibacterales bacterium]
MTPVAGAPRVAVVLPVFNGEVHIGDAVRSVLAQTFTDFQLLVIDDGSTDGTARILSSFSDPRLRVIQLAGHQGLVPALNRGIRESTSLLIARMDADDVCLPRRFERQVAFLETHPDVDICGSWTRHVGERRGVRRLPVDPEHIRARMFLGGALDHPAIMMRRAFVEGNGLAYRDDFAGAEDLDFLTRAADVGRLANVPEILLLYRAHPQQVSVVRAAAQASTHARIAARQLRALVPDADEDEVEFHVRLVLGQILSSERARAEHWLLRLDEVNGLARRYDAAAFRAELRRLWFRVHDRPGQPAFGTLREYWSSPLSGVRGVGVLRHARFVARSVTPL